MTRQAQARPSRPRGRPRGTRTSPAPFRGLEIGAPADAFVHRPEVHARQLQQLVPVTDRETGLVEDGGPDAWHGAYRALGTIAKRSKASSVRAASSKSRSVRPPASCVDQVTLTRL
jgi:hypothetical protein